MRKSEKSNAKYSRIPAHLYFHARQFAKHTAIYDVITPLTRTVYLQRGGVYYWWRNDVTVSSPHLRLSASRSDSAAISEAAERRTANFSHPKVRTIENRTYTLQNPQYIHVCTMTTFDNV